VKFVMKSMGFAVMLAWVALGAAPLAAQTLRLNEILPGPARDWDGSGTFSSRDDEWIEVINTGVAPIDLAGWYVTDGDSIPRYAFQGTLDGGARRMVTGRESFDWERASGFPAFGFSLANSGDAVLLWQVAGSDTTLVDAYAYRAHEAAADRAIGRLPEGIGTWVLFDALNPYAGATPPPGSGCPPTPGASNACSTTPVQSATWGAVRKLYR
jgi:Lamin Tail Domain